MMIRTLTRAAARDRWIPVALVVLLAVGTVALLSLRPPTASTARSVAAACQREYAGARTVADSLVVDAQVWELDKGLRRKPSCGEVRRTAR
jgi:hypothetical protein